MPKSKTEMPAEFENFTWHPKFLIKDVIALYVYFSTKFNGFSKDFNDVFGVQNIPLLLPNQVI